MTGARSLLPALALGCILVAPKCAWGASSQGQTVTFNRHVAPIIFENCVTCHNPGGPAPFSLLSYQDAAQRAQFIKRVTQRRYMPPWLPDSGYGHFSGDRSLSQAQIDIIARWVDAGSPEGETEDRLEPPDIAHRWQLGEPDLVVNGPSFEISPHGTDQYRNLVIPIPIDETKYVRSVELRPGGTNVVHHARMMTDTTNSSRLLDAEDTGPGFDGMQHVSNATNPNGFFVGWTPGKVPYQSPPDMSWRLDPGTDLLLQLHLPPSDESQNVAPSIGFYFADKPPSRKPALIMLGSFEIDIPPGVEEYVVTDSFQLPVAASALAVYPHAHYLGKRIEGYADLPDGSRTWLIRISDWDFNWQDEYHFERPVDLPEGSTITMRIVYDNSANNPRNPSNPPRRVVYGSNSTDEMADLVVQVLPKDQSDLGFLQRNIDIWQYNSAITQMARVERTQGLAFAAEGNLAEAIEKLRSSIEYVSDDPETHNHLGSALAMTGNLSVAAAHFREAGRLNPNWAEPAVNLAMTQLALATQPGLDEAVASARRAANLTGQTDPAVLDLLARTLAATDQMQEAIATAERALGLAVDQNREGLASEIRGRLMEWR